MFCPQEETKIFQAYLGKVNHFPNIFYLVFFRIREKKMEGDYDDVLIPIPFL